MRRLSLLVTLALSASLLGCPLLDRLKKKPPPADDGVAEDLSLVDAEAVRVEGTGAKNESSVMRYKDEQAIGEVAVIGRDGTTVRAFPGNGPEVATIGKGTPVLQVAKYFHTGVLVMFDDPTTNDGTKLLGWVTPSSFDEAAPKPVWIPPKIVDAGARTVVVHDAGGGGKASVDAGVGPKDAGAPKVVADAGSAKPKVVDAGSAAIPQPKPGTVAVPPIGGKCPDGWLVERNMCRRSCKADGECPRNTKCLTGSGGKKVCTSG